MIVDKLQFKYMKWPWNNGIKLKIHLNYRWWLIHSKYFTINLDLM